MLYDNARSAVKEIAGDGKRRPTEAFSGLSERLTGALLDRLKHHVHILKMNGDSFRLKNSRKKKDPGPH